MNNKQANKIFYMHLNGARINKLFWIAASGESFDLKEFMDELRVKDWLKAIPELKDCEYFTEFYKESQMFEVITILGKFGFIAEVHYPICHNFTFNEDGKPTSFSGDGSCMIGYVYAETREELIDKIQIEADELFKEFINDDKIKKRLHDSE